MHSVLLIIILVAITGCASKPTPRPTIEWKKVQTAEKMLFDDTDAIFLSVFGNNDLSRLQKGKLENELEYKQRLAKAGEGIVGREVTFLISPEDCDVYSFPDKRNYTIQPKGRSIGHNDFLYETLDVKSHQSQNGSTIMQNAFGASVRVDSRNHISNILEIKNKESLPASILETDGFGLTISTSGVSLDIDVKLRKLIAEKRLGLIVRGRILNIAMARFYTSYSKPTYTSPTEYNSIKKYLPFEIKAMGVVTMTNGIPYRVVEFVQP